MEIYLSNSGQEPIYAQITRQIKQQILSGALRPGDALPSIRLLAKELRIKSVFRYVNMFPKTVAAIAAGAPVEQVVTHEYALEDIQQAFDDSVHRKNEVVKAIIRIKKRTGRLPKTAVSRFRLSKNSCELRF